VCGGNLCLTHEGKIFVSCTSKLFVSCTGETFVCGGNVCEVKSVMRPPSRTVVRSTSMPMALAVASDAMTSL
jgi:hypothetical protein